MTTKTEKQSFSKLQHYIKSLLIFSEYKNTEVNVLFSTRLYLRTYPEINIYRFPKI